MKQGLPIQDTFMIPLTREEVRAVMTDIEEELKHEADPWEQRALENELQQGRDMLGELQ